jgi:protein N-lysine methyltransferase METTL21D
VLGDYLHRSALSFSCKRVVELGTGPGLGAIAAALCDDNISEVIATDGDDQLLLLTKENMDLNILAPPIRNKCRCEVLLWGNESQAQALSPPFDVILAADCAALVYENSFADLVSTFEALSDENSLIFLSYHRRHHSEDQFFVLLSQKFTYKEVDTNNIHPDFRSSDITVFEIRRSM